jgi:hypothetical protein
LRRHAQGAIELAGGILPGNDHRQLDDLVVGELLLDADEEIVVHVAVAVGDGVRVFEREAFAVIEERAIFPMLQRGELVVRNVLLAADGSVQVCSELAAVNQRDPAVQYGLELVVD